MGSGNTDNLYKEKYKVSKIVRVKDSGFKPTFDVTVENAHSYVSNSFVTHNLGRMKHKLVCNIPRVTSLYGGNIRAMFGVNPDEQFVQYAYDFSSLEAVLEAHFVGNMMKIKHLVTACCKRSLTTCTASQPGRFPR